MSEDVIVLGAGMHPWGKWGRNFADYAIEAALMALDDAEVDWTDIQFVAGGETVRNGYPGYVAASTFAQALGWNGLASPPATRRAPLGQLPSRLPAQASWPASATSPS